MSQELTDGRGTKLSSGPLVGLLVLSCALAASCKDDKIAELEKELEAKAKPVEAHEVKSAKLPESAMIGDNVTLSGFMEDVAPEAGEEGEQGQIDRAATGPQPQGSVREVYRRVAPATVIVKTGRGYGSGVIYDKGGWILTNHHVVKRADKDGFRWKVQVKLGHLKDGVMEKDDRLFDAYVHKIDPLHDLAVIKLVKPPKSLTAVAISDEEPKPGEAVSAVGHAGIGLAWAIKDGQISAIGTLAKHLAQMMLYEDNKRGGKGRPRGRLGRLYAQRLEQYKRKLERRTPALVIQSTCDISQGDSGGPLVNRQAELVGLNAFVRSARHARKESNFHIHVREIRKFLKKVPKKPPQLLPDPWVDGGIEARADDTDGDGKLDLLGLVTVHRYRFFRRSVTRRRIGAYFFDLDQDSFAGSKAKSAGKKPNLKQVIDKRSFDAELIYLQHGKHIYVWYDTDDKKGPDVLLVANRFRRTVEQAYRIDGEGELSPDGALASGQPIRPELITDAKQRARLVSLAPRVFDARLLPKGMVAEKTSDTHPDPLYAAGRAGTLEDNSGDRRADTIHADGLLASARLFDIDQDSLAAFNHGHSWAEVRKWRKSHGIDIEISWIKQRTVQWAWYDLDNDHTWDLLLRASRAPYATVDAAWRITGDGKHVETNEFSGRKLIQPYLLKRSYLARRAYLLMRRVVPSDALATGPGVGSFVDPDRYLAYRAQLVDVGRYRQVAAKVRWRRCRTILVDVDRDSRRIARKQSTTVEQLVKKKKFDAEFAQVRCLRDLWSFYDSRGKGRYDVVVYSADGGKGKPDAAYLIDYDSDKSSSGRLSYLARLRRRKGKGPMGTVKPREKPIACEGTVHPRLFRSRKLRRAFTRIAPKLLTDVAPRRCKP